MIIEELTSQAFLEGLTKTETVLVPVGATEGHGAHLPLQSGFQHFTFISFYFVPAAGRLSYYCFQSLSFSFLN